MTYLMEGIRVIDAASFLAGPGAATVMADFGADVINENREITTQSHSHLRGRSHHPIVYRDSGQTGLP